MRSVAGRHLVVGTARDVRNCANQMLLIARNILAIELANRLDGSTDDIGTAADCWWKLK
jgi:hypothetical protein